MTDILAISAHWSEENQCNYFGVRGVGTRYNDILKDIAGFYIVGTWSYFRFVFLLDEERFAEKYKQYIDFNLEQADAYRWNVENVS